MRQQGCQAGLLGGGLNPDEEPWILKHMAGHLDDCLALSLTHFQVKKAEAEAATSSSGKKAVHSWQILEAAAQASRPTETSCPSGAVTPLLLAAKTISEVFSICVFKLKS